MELDPHGNCGICKQGLENKDLVICPTCAALYHRGCWVYNGGRCAAYACVEAIGEPDPLPSLKAVSLTGKGGVSPPILPDLPPPAVDTNLGSHSGLPRGTIGGAIILIVVMAVVELLRSLFGV